MNILAGTGHRPHRCAIGKIKAYSDYQSQVMYEIASQFFIYYEVDLALSGGALGWDTAICRAAYALKVPYHVYVPFAGQESQWPKDNQDKYHKMLEYAEKVIIVSEGDYTPQKMQKRNQALVDNCNILLALWNGKQEGGTWNCIQYAKRVGRETTNAWPSYEEYAK